MVGVGVRATVAAAITLVAFAAPAQAAPSGLNAYSVKIDNGHATRLLAQQGFDITEGGGADRIEIVATAGQARALHKYGLDPQLKQTGFARTAAIRADGSYQVFRPYWDHTYVGTVDGNPTSTARETLYEEFSRLANEHPDIVKPEIIGHSINGKPILALRITRDAREPTNPDGSRPAAAYIATQHAREWIVPEQARRLAHLFIDNYGRSGAAKDTNANDIAGLTASELTSLVNSREIWIVPVANPDGYDYTFTPGNRLWRKNLHDNNGDGNITIGDGVDPNRNFPKHWGFDNEGSSNDPATETYRGTGPASEPETQAMDALFRRVGFEFLVNYHSAAELLLYGTGFQVQTNSQDDPIYRAFAGTPTDPAIGSNPPGAPDRYLSELSSGLYTTNGDTDDTAHAVHHTLSFTPEMDVSDPARGGGNSVFEFQDSEADIEQVFEKNIPFALDVAKSAADPANPVSHLGRDAPSFESHPFTVSFGNPQKVRVNVKRSLGPVTVHWTVNAGAEHTATTTEYRGGRRYGGDLDVYYHEMRGMVSGTGPGDHVKVWFEAGTQRSQSFGYDVRSDTGHEVLIMAAEDYSGKAGGSVESPAYADRTHPNYLDYYKAALTANGITYDVYDVDAEGRTAPDPMGVLSHYQAIVWYTGNDTLIRAVGVPGGTGVGRLANDEILAVRDYLNDGGKLLYTGQNAAYAQVNAFPFNPLGEPPYCDAANPGSPGSAQNCIPLSNDFLQYWLGAYIHIDAASTKADASALPFHAPAPFGDMNFNVNGAGSADNQGHAYSMVTTSSILPAVQYPQFSSGLATTFDRPPAFDPLTGTHYAVASNDDEGYQRLRKTIDLTGKAAAALSFKISYDTEPTYDYVIVEAHHVGQDDWTTLPDTNGHTSTDVGASCDINWDTLHPFLAHYQTNTNKDQTPGAEDCTGTGTTGSWNGATGNSGGYQDWKLDLSAYAGSQVEVSITYVQDFASSGLGVFVDDANVTADGAVVDQTSFEDGLGGFTAGPPPAGSEAGTQQEWTSRTTVGYLDGPGIQTPRSVYWGFGFEGVSSPTNRARLMAGAMRHLDVPAPPPDGGGTTGSTTGTTGTTGTTTTGTTTGGSTTGSAGGGSKPRVVISRRVLRADRRGQFGVGVLCPASTRRNVCRGVVRVGTSSRLLVRRAFAIPADVTTTVPAALNRSGRALLRRKGSLLVYVTAETRGQDGVFRRRGEFLILVRAAT
jgi:murein tripeptide amidase MpaA